MSPLIRFATPADAEGVLTIYSPIIVNTPISFEMEPPTVDEMQGRIQTTLTRYPWLVCEIDNGVAGYVYGGAYRKREAYQWSVEVTAYVHPDHYRRGIGRALYIALFEILRLQGYYEAFAGITLPNDDSVRLHEALGFEPIGVYRRAGFKQGLWHDVGWWQMSLQPSQPNPTPPQTVQVLRDTAEVREVIEKSSSMIR